MQVCVLWNDIGPFKRVRKTLKVILHSCSPQALKPFIRAFKWGSIKPCTWRDCKVVAHYNSKCAKRSDLQSKTEIYSHTKFDDLP